MKAINLIFPHQLFEESVLLDNDHACYLVEEFLFFKHYQFHQQKIAFHRASMKAYETHLQSQGKTVHYIEASNALSDIRNFEQELQQQGITEVHAIDPTDDWLLQRLQAVCQGIELHLHESPLFLNSKADLSTFFRSDKKSFFQTSFYKQQRKQRQILMDADQQPVGGKWTYDAENRKKYPKGKTPPPIHFPAQCTHWEEAVAYTKTHFGNHSGQLSNARIYPIDAEEARAWLQQFLTYRFYDFGVYEDAIVREHLILNHSLLSPLLNVGLLSPDEVVKTALDYAQREDIPINSTEGFIRQMIGWREFIRGMYECKGKYARTLNFWGFKRKIPSPFYNGTTGIAPIDVTIKKVLDTGYCHHIERLMILGNFMLLCEFDPDEVYRWFMELFIDAYDWVMVPNVYGMCLFADGGTFATKPYIGGSNYLKKMSNFGSGPWDKTWDGLFWNFMFKHQEFFRSNPRTSMLVHSMNKMAPEKRAAHLAAAAAFFEELDRA